MSAALPLLLLTLLSALIVAIWGCLGPGLRSQRLTIAAVFFIALALSWALLISFGGFHTLGQYAIAAGFLVGLGGLALPTTWRYFLKKKRQI